jgi:3-oxoacyl-[acyl-carrier protein] reductase
MPDGLAGKVAIVTGTAHGIGAAIAAALRADGATVHGVDKDQADLTDSAAVRAFFAAIGPADILVNNAGGVCGQVGHPLEEVPDADWHTVVNANLTTAFHCTRAVVPGMKQRGWGRIVNIASAAGLTVSKTGIQAYASAKAGMNPTTQLQWQGYGPDGQRALIDGIATRSLGEPADIANGVQFFASMRSGWVTGQVIAIDGGSAFQ